jgi:hypothetical protein
MPVSFRPKRRCRLPRLDDHGRLRTVRAHLEAHAIAPPSERPLRSRRVWPLPSVAPPPEEGIWAFHSRPELSPAAVEVTTTQAHGDTAPGYIFAALKEGAGEHGPMKIDDQGLLVWFGK